MWGRLAACVALVMAPPGPSDNRLRVSNLPNKHVSTVQLIVAAPLSQSPLTLPAHTGSPYGAKRAEIAAVRQGFERGEHASLSQTVDRISE